MADKWYKEHGHAPGYNKYLKNRKKKKQTKKSEVILKLFKLSQKLDNTFPDISDYIDNLLFNNKEIN